jgi:hypothetical protein
MSEPIQIKIIVAGDDCDDCNRAIATIASAVKQSNRDCTITKLLFELPEAIDLAVEKGMDDLPSFIVGDDGEVFVGNNYTEEAIVNAINNSPG